MKSSKLNLNILDCTLRDGGYYTNWDYDKDLVESYINAVNMLPIAAIEIGLRTRINSSFKGPFAFSPESVLQQIRNTLRPDISIAIMINVSELKNSNNLIFELEKLFPDSVQDTNVDMVRLATHIQDAGLAQQVARWCKQRGFRVAVNLMQIGLKDSNEVKSAISQLTQEAVDVLYLADSTGSILPKDMPSLIQSIRSHWAGEMGIHAHDNLNLALSNSLIAIDNGVSWIDSTVLGMGRGPGNTKTEELVLETYGWTETFGKLQPLMRLISNYFAPMKTKHQWGSNIYYYMAGKFGIHPSFVQQMLADSRYDADDIVNVIQRLHQIGAQEYSPTHLQKAMNWYSEPQEGQWIPKAQLKGKSILLLGAGPSTNKYKSALEAFITREKPVVIALNLATPVEESLINLRVACHPLRIFADVRDYQKYSQPLIAPLSALPQDVVSELSDIEVLDYGLQVSDQFMVQNTFCEIPSSLVLGYALAICQAGETHKIYMAGFDGYPAGDSRNIESEHIFGLYALQQNPVPLISVTPTRYNLSEVSVFGLID